MPVVPGLPVDSVGNALANIVAHPMLEQAGVEAMEGPATVFQYHLNDPAWAVVAEASMRRTDRNSASGVEMSMP